MRRPHHMIRFALFAAVLLLATAARASHWQITVIYDGEGARIVAADPIPPMTKTVRTPGLAGAVAVVDYDARWLDGSGRELATTRTVMPLGRRGLPEMSGEAAAWVPEEDAVVLRLEGPPAGATPSVLELKRTGLQRGARTASDLPAGLQAPELALSVPTVRTPRVAGPFGSVKLRDTGPDQNRAVLVVMGDGYTAANHTAGDFAGDAQTLVTALTGQAPWDEIGAATNIYRIDIESNEQGADDKDCVSCPWTYVDTHLNATFWGNNIERLLILNSTGRARAFGAADTYVGVGVWDEVFVLANSTKYGGSGGSLATSSVHSSAAEIIIHEAGHTFAGLADEYETPYPGFPAGDSEPNVDFDASGPGLKWLEWVEPGTPLPTPDTSGYNNRVGTFEGARYLSSGIYRPWRNCKMRSLGPAFCPVCVEAHIYSFHGLVQPLDSTSHPVGSTIDVPPEGVDVTAQGIPLPTMEYEWTLDGVPIPGADGPTITLIPADLDGRQILAATVRNGTDRIRGQEVSRTIQWWAESTASPSYWLFR